MAAETIPENCPPRKRGRKPRDLSGLVVGRLAVLHITDERQHGQAVWLCQCECGSLKGFPGRELTHGRTRSCGCLKREKGYGRTCAVAGCDSPQIAQGWCGKHYYRWRRHGDPEIVRPKAADRAEEKARRSAEWRARLASAASRKPRTCEHCRSTFYRQSKGDRDKGRFCSRECAFAALRVVGRLTPGHIPKALRRVSFTVRRRRCRHCDTPFTVPKQGGAIYCSDDCRAERQLISARDRAIAQSVRDLGPRPCKGCGLAFSPEYGDQRRVFCSKPCSMRHARKRFGNKYRSRARYHGVEYEPIPVEQVFERDRWRCQVCGRKTPKRWRGTRRSNAPELDHRIAMAMGGGHVWANVQCACRECNQRKGGTVVVGQMPLFLKGAEGAITS